MTYLHHGDAVVARLSPGVGLGSLRRVAQDVGEDDPGGRGGGGCRNPGGGGGGHLPAAAPPAPALVDPPQREQGRDSDAVGFPPASEVHAADSVPRGGLEGAEAAADPGPGDVPQPQLPQRGVLRKRVEAQVAVPVRVVVAAGDTAGEPGHGGRGDDGVESAVYGVKRGCIYCCFL